MLHQALAQACPALASGLQALLRAVSAQTGVPEGPQPGSSPALVRRAAALLAAVGPHMPAAEAQVQWLLLLPVSVSIRLGNTSLFCIGKV